LTNRSFRGHTDIVTSVEKLTNDRIISCSFDSKIRLWNLFTGECLNIINASTEQILCMDVLTNSQIIAASGHEMKVWDVNSGRCLKTLERSHSQDINYLLAF